MVETTLIKTVLDYSLWVGLTILFSLYLLKQSKTLNDNLIKQNQVFAEKLEQIVWLMTNLAAMMGKTHLDKQDAIDYFRLVLDAHIRQKLEIVGDILDKNDIQRRRKEIENRIRTEFARITKCWAEKLSKINSPVGDMGQMLLDVDFDLFFVEVFDVLFREDNKTDKNEYIRTKIRDIRIIMEGYVNELINKMYYGE